MAEPETARGARRPGALHRRQVDVLQALATGLSTAEAAEQLGLAAEQVRADLKAAMLALGARTKLEAILAAHRAGLLDLGQEHVAGGGARVRRRHVRL